MTILAESQGWNPIITNVLLVVHIVVCLLLCLVVLMQRPKQEGLGAAFGGGMTDQAFGARTTDVLQKGTVYLASLLFIITLVLSILVGTKSRNTNISDELEASGATAIEENGDAAAAAAALAGDDADTDLSAAVDAVTGEADGDKDAEKKEDTEEGTPVPAPAPAPVDPAIPAPPAPPAAPGDSGNSGQ